MKLLPLPAVHGEGGIRVQAHSTGEQFNEVAYVNGFGQVFCPAFLECCQVVTSYGGLPADLTEVHASCLTGRPEHFPQAVAASLLLGAHLVCSPGALASSTAMPAASALFSRRSLRFTSTVWPSESSAMRARSQGVVSRPCTPAASASLIALLRRSSSRAWSRP